MFQCVMTIKYRFYSYYTTCNYSDTIFYLLHTHLGNAGLNYFLKDQLTNNEGKGAKLKDINILVVTIAMFFLHLCTLLVRS